MKPPNVREAKTYLTRLVRALKAKLVPIRNARRQLGADRGLVYIAPDFDSPEVNAEIAALFEGD